MYSCIDRKYFLPVSFLPIFLVSLTIADTIGQSQILVKPQTKWRAVMKISQCVTTFFNYQRMNVKKKYVKEL